MHIAPMNKSLCENMSRLPPGKCTKLPIPTGATAGTGQGKALPGFTGTQ